MIRIANININHTAGDRVSGHSLFCAEGIWLCNYKDGFM